MKVRFSKVRLSPTAHKNRLQKCSEAGFLFFCNSESILCLLGTERLLGGAVVIGLDFRTAVGLAVLGVRHGGLGDDDYF